MSCQYIDVHTHLYDSKFDEDLSDVIARAIQAGVKRTIVVSECSTDCDKILSLTNKFPDFCFPGFGVHPVQAGLDGVVRSACQQDVELLEPFIDQYNERLVCIGEVGLDFTPRYCKTIEDKESQRSVLRSLVQKADVFNLPLNVHSRSAGRPTIALLKSAGARNVLLHAFDGKPSVALEGAQCGYYFSVPPSVIRCEQTCRLIEAVPLDQLLLETDSPALGPEKRKRNEPENLVISCQHIARLKHTSVEAAAAILWENSLRLFPKLRPAE